MLPILFFIVSFVYSLVGFGGGSTYISLLALFKTPYHLIAATALICNIAVVSQASIRIIKNKTLDQKIFYFLLPAVPASFLGGLIPISKEIFLFLLGIVLILAGIAIFLTKSIQPEQLKEINYKVSLIAIVIGFISGLVGIGGGIFLAPALYFFKVATEKKIAALCTIFILVNSIAGLLGQFTKFQGDILSSHLLLLVAAVTIGGVMGSSLLYHQKTSALLIKRMSALLIIFVGLRLIFF